MIYIPYFLFVTVICVLLCIPGVLLNIWLCKIGVSRDSKKTIIVLTTFFFTFLQPFFYEDMSLWEYGAILAVLTALTVHFSDFVETMKHGKWWWKTAEKAK